ncbi:Hypothetical protein CINCED_3A010339 [Cinara cedri]|nr:Hypothetical protein CINCED_3A010339 [Cinara cedri]
MVKYCILCHTNKIQNSDLSFHKFPINIMYRNEWIKKLNLTTAIKRWYRICNLHFTASDYNVQNKRMVLKADAVPTFIINKDIDSSNNDNDCAVIQSLKHPDNFSVGFPKSYLLQAVELILQPKSVPVGRKAKIMGKWNKIDAMKVNSLCSDQSHLPVYSSIMLYRENPLRSLSPILNEMRLCLLAGDWDGYKDLLLLVLRSSIVSSGYILFVIRSSFILLFNHPNRTPQVLDTFLRACIYLTDHRRIKYLESCFTFKGTLAHLLDKTVMNIEDNEKEEEEEEEEIIFNSEFSSDEEVS